jgi:hypothetical protein
MSLGGCVDLAPRQRMEQGNKVEIATHELIGLPLDWGVAQCMGYTNLRFHREPSLDGAWIMDPPRKEYGPVLLVDHAPSTDWAEGGPIGESEEIHAFTQYPRSPIAPLVWYARRRGSFQMSGPTQLVAVMRCLVASKLGPAIDVPDELISSAPDAVATDSAERRAKRRP